MAVVVATAGQVRADLAPLGVPARAHDNGALATPSTDIERLVATSAFESTAWAADEWLATSIPDAATAPLPNTAATPQNEIREMPALPGSAALFLSAVLSIGGWHMARSARSLHWSALPTWYHSGGPLQIGHAVPCDLDFSAAPLCCFEQPTEERPVTLREVPQRVTPLEDQCDLASAAPRGPPEPSF